MASHRRLILAAAFVALAFGMLYWQTIARQFTYDGLCYALDVQRGPATNLFNNNHLLYSVINRVLWNAAQTFGLKMRALFFMQRVNAAVAGLTVGLLWFFLARETDTVSASAATALFAFGRSYWREVTDPGCYAWTVLAAFILLWILVEAPRRRAAFVGAVHGLIILFHIIFVVAVPAFCLRYWLLRRMAARRIIAYGAYVFAVVFLGYGAVCWRFHPGPWIDALKWVMTPSGPPVGAVVFDRYWWTFGLSNIAPWWNGWLSAFVALAPSTMAQVAEQVLFALAMGAGCYILIKRSLSAPPDSPWAALAALIVCMSAFQFVFWPGAERYRLVMMPAIAWILSQWFARGKQDWARVALVIAVLIGALNFSLVIAPRRQWPADLKRLSWVVQQVRANDFFVYEGADSASSIINVYVAYFAPTLPSRSLAGYLFAHPDGNPVELAERLHQSLAAGGRIWIEESLYRALQKPSKIIPPLVAHAFDGMRPVEEASGPGGYRLLALSDRSSTTKTRSAF